MNIISKVLNKLFSFNKLKSNENNNSSPSIELDDFNNTSEIEVEIKEQHQYDHTDLYDHTIVSAWIYNNKTNEVLIECKNDKYNLPNGKSNPNESPYLSIKRITNELFNVLVKKSKQVNKFNKTYIRKDSDNIERIVKTTQYSYLIINYIGELCYNENEYKFINLNEIDLSRANDQLKKSINHFKKILDKGSEKNEK